MISTRRLRSEKSRSVPCLIEPLEARQLLDAITVTVPENGKVTFIGPGDTLYSIQFAKCQGNVTFDGDNLEQSTLMNGIPIVKGNVTMIDSIDVPSGVGPGSIIMKGKANQLELKSFVSAVALSLVKLQPVSLQGAATANEVSYFNVGSMKNANVQFAVGSSSAPPMTIVCGDVTDSKITAGAGVKSLTMGKFTATTPGNLTAPGSSIFAAPSLWNMKIGGNSSGDIDITGGSGYGSYVLGSAMVKGDVTGGNWAVHGNTWYVGAHSFGSGWDGTMYGGMLGFKTAQDFSGNLTAGSISKATFGRNIFDANIRLTYNFKDFDSWKIGNSMVNSNTYGAGSFGSATMQFMEGSTMAAGVGPTFSFSPTYTFANPNATFDSLNVHCHTMMTTFADSFVGAPTLGNLNLGMAQTPSSEQFGVLASKVIKQIKVAFKNKQVNVDNVVNATSFEQALQAAGVSSQDAQNFAVLFSPQ